MLRGAKRQFWIGKSEEVHWSPKIPPAAREEIGRWNCGGNVGYVLAAAWACHPLGGGFKADGWCAIDCLLHW
jgi:hypothetical protein